MAVGLGCDRGITNPDRGAVRPTAGQPAVADVNEAPPGNDVSISYNVIHVDRLTGRARLERQDAL